MNIWQGATNEGAVTFRSRLQRSQLLSLAGWIGAPYPEGIDANRPPAVGITGEQHPMPHGRSLTL